MESMANRRLGVLVAPADVAGDRVLLGGVAGIVAAVEGEVAQRGELDSIQFSQEALVGVNTSSMSLSAHQSATLLFLCGEKLSQITYSFPAGNLARTA